MARQACINATRNTILRSRAPKIRSDLSTDTFVSFISANFLSLPLNYRHCINFHNFYPKLVQYSKLVTIQRIGLMRLNISSGVRKRLNPSTNSIVQNYVPVLITAVLTSTFILKCYYALSRPLFISGPDSNGYIPGAIDFANKKWA